MAPSSKKTTKKTARIQNNNLMPPMKPGETRNPNGRPKGTRNYSTISREAIRKIAESQSLTPEEFEQLLIQSGINQALKGDYRYYKDHFDRTFGKAPQPLGNPNEDGEVILTIKRL